MTRRLLAVVLLALAAGGLPAPGAQAQQQPLDCEGPAPDAQPGTVEWIVRDANNLLCTTERHADKANHPALAGGAPSVANDPYRAPGRHDGIRFRFDTPEIPGVSEAEVYRPCPTDPGICPDLPDSLERFDGPYPVAVLLHGGGSRKELHWWSSQTLAEAGYLVVTMDGAGQASARAVLDWLPTQPDVDLNRIGIAGHSIGGDAAAIVAQTDGRVGALVGWDRAGLSSPPHDRFELPPAIFLVSDYACPAPLVCPPRPYTEKPDPSARGAKTQDFGLSRQAGIDTMQVGLRATTHFEWVPGLLAGNRYGELMNVHYTITWFDRYLRGEVVRDGAGSVVASHGRTEAEELAHRLVIAQGAFGRLTASTYDDYVDRFNISQGFWDPDKALASGDPVYGGNVPYTLGGKPVRDRLSFYFDSKCFLTVPGSQERVTSEDIRASGCE